LAFLGVQLINLVIGLVPHSSFEAIRVFEDPIGLGPSIKVNLKFSGIQSLNVAFGSQQLRLFLWDPRLDDSLRALLIEVREGILSSPWSVQGRLARVKGRLARDDRLD